MFKKVILSKAHQGSESLVWVHSSTLDFPDQNYPPKLGLCFTVLEFHGICSGTSGTILVLHQLQITLSSKCPTS